jgi:hypothetical protein
MVFCRRYAMQKACDIRMDMVVGVDQNCIPETSHIGLGNGAIVNVKVLGFDRSTSTETNSLLGSPQYHGGKSNPKGESTGNAMTD